MNIFKCLKLVSASVVVVALASCGGKSTVSTTKATSDYVYLDGVIVSDPAHAPASGNGDFGLDVRSSVSGVTYNVAMVGSLSEYPATTVQNCNNDTGWLYGLQYGDHVYILGDRTGSTIIAHSLECR